MRCKVCKEKFEPKYFLQKTCFNTSCVLEWSKQVKKKEWNQKKVKIKEKLKTRSEHLNDFQKIFNKYIRLRDNGNVCISCKKQCKKENAGHYRSVGANPELRFEELNCHLQCEYCNTYLHGNLIEYRINLIDKIGINKVEWLEGNHKPKKYTIHELKEMKNNYRAKIKVLENK